MRSNCHGTYFSNRLGNLSVRGGIGYYRGGYYSRGGGYGLGGILGTILIVLLIVWLLRGHFGGL